MRRFFRLLWCRLAHPRWEAGPYVLLCDCAARSPIGPASLVESPPPGGPLQTKDTSYEQ